MLPEAADVVTRRHEYVGDAERNTALASRSTVKAPGPEEVDELSFLGSVLLSLATPELPECAHHELHLRQVRAALGARPHVLIEARTLGRR